MKILYLTPTHLDYLSDQLYSGLCAQLGWQAVVEYPYKALYHDPDRRATCVRSTPGGEHGFEEVVEGLARHAYDVVILSALRAEPLGALERFASKVDLPPVVLIDGDDGKEIRRELFYRFKCGLYFKREYAQYGDGLKGSWLRRLHFRGDEDLYSRTYPLQFSVVLDAMPLPMPRARTVDVSFVGHASHRKRIKAAHLLAAAEGLSFQGGIYAEPTTRQSKLASAIPGILLAKLRGDPYATEDERRPKMSLEQYFDLLGRSKVAVSVRGAGFDTLRYWEIVACRTVLVSERPDIEIPNNFEHGAHALFCRPDLSDLVDLVRACVSDEAARTRMTEEAYRHLVRFHTCERRAEYLLELCRKRL